jgi:hypothetical protein
VAERVVERVDDSIKAEVMHYAAEYVSTFLPAPISSIVDRLLHSGITNETWEQNDISP